MSFFEELRRRNVFRVAIGYVITVWLLLQVVDLVLENINAPDWVMQVFMLALAIGFPLAVFFAWAFEMTPDGVKRESEVDRTKTITKKTGRKMDRHIIIAMALALAYFAYDKFSGPEQDSVPQVTQTTSTTEDDTSATNSAPITKTGEKSVAVLPFINMSKDEENEYFSDGISEELLNVLVRVKGLRVPSRTSSFTFKGSSLKLSEIGKELQVDHILEGSVRKSGDRIRVTAQLIEVSTDTHLWSETYTRQLDDIFAVQDEIAQAIVSALKITLTDTDVKPVSDGATVNVEAYNKYLLGRHLWNQRNPASILAAVVPLGEAVEIDPQFGRAWEALADAYVLIPEYGAGTLQEYLPLAHNAIQMALDINPESAPALTTSAYMKFMYDYDFKSAEQEFRKAISIDTNYATGHQWYAELLAAQDRLDEALDQFRLARRADPLAPILPFVMGWALAYSDRSEEAYQYIQEALQLNPNMQAALRELGRLNLMNGRYDLAREFILKSAAANETDPTTQLAYIDAVENPALKEKALALIVPNTNIPDGVMFKSYMLMHLGEPELALDSLERAFQMGSPYSVHMKRMVIYDPLRDNPRFQALLKKMNMWP